MILFDVPLISIAAPPTGTIYDVDQDTIALAALVSFNDASIDDVEFFINGQSAGFATSQVINDETHTGTYYLTADGPFAPGPASIRAVAYVGSNAYNSQAVRARFGVLNIPLSSSISTNYSPEGTRENSFKTRVFEVLGAAASEYPSLFVHVDAWRQMVVSGGGYIDDSTLSWVRLGEGIEAFNLQKEERWFETGVGVIRQQVNWLIVPDGYGLQAGDTILLNGDAWFVTQAPENMGVQKLTLDKEKNRFVMPAPDIPTYRVVYMKACIGNG